MTLQAWQWRACLMQVPYSEDGMAVARLARPGDAIKMVAVTVTIAGDTGLGFHRSLDPNERDHRVVCHVASGYRFPGSVKTEAAARRWIELIADVLDWKQPAETLFALEHEERRKIARVLSNARTQASEQEVQA